MIIIKYSFIFYYFYFKMFKTTLRNPGVFFFFQIHVNVNLLMALTWNIAEYDISYNLYHNDLHS